MKGFSVILLIFLIFHSSLALPKPQEEDEKIEDDTTPVPQTAEANTVKVDEDEALLTAAPEEDETTQDGGSKEKGIITPVVTQAPPEVQAVVPVIQNTTLKPEPVPVTTKESSENDDTVVIVVPGKPEPENTNTKPVDADAKDECGPACQLANQAPLILFIVILVVIILLLIILFGCYFMKKLHGKAILTANKNLPKQPSDITHRTFDSKAVVDPTTGKKIVTTTTTQVTKSVGGAFTDVSL